MVLKFLRKNIFIISTILIYFVFTIFYMGPSVWRCNSTVYGFGDNTSGFIWKEQIGQKEIFGGYEKYTNFPYGENTFSPVAVSFVGQVAVYKLASKLTNPVCGYNVLNFIGFVSAAIIMFLFISWLTKNKWIALIAGYAFSFTPYFQIKVGGHPGYGYQGIILASLWSFFALVKKPSRTGALIFGLTTAVSFYFDPYFSLLTMTALLPCGFIWLALNIKGIIQKKHEPIKTLKVLLLSVLVGIIGLIPLISTKILYSEQINSFVSESRGDIRQAAINCSNYPFEYLAPSPVHPLLDNIFGSQTAKMKSFMFAFANCGLGEDVVGIALVILAVVGVGEIIILWELLNKQKLYKKNNRINVSPKYIYTGVTLFILCAVILALPPAKIGPIPLPSELLIETTTVWRIISREYVVVNMGVVILFALFMDYFIKKINMNKFVKIIIYLFISISLVIQYQTTKPLTGSPNTFRYSDAPKAYTFIKNTENIKALAEYPIEKSGVLDGIGYYLTMQSIYRKPLLNSTLPNSPDENIRATIKNLQDPVTVPTLNSLGIDTVVVHGVEANIVEDIPYLDVIFVDNHQPFGHIPATGENIKDILVVAKIVKAPVIKSILTFKDMPPYNHELIKSPVDWVYDVRSGTQMSRRYLIDQSDKDESEGYCFYVKSSIVNDVLSIEDSRGIIGDYGINQVPVPINFKYIDNVKINTKSGKNVAISKIGC